MKIELICATSQSAMFDALTQMILYDIKENTKETIDPSELHGYVYEKKMDTKLGNAHQCHIVIDAYQIPSKYETALRSSQGIYRCCYVVEAISEEECKVAYEESFDAMKTLGNINYKMVSMFYTRGTKKKIIHRIRQLEHLANQEVNA